MTEQPPPPPPPEPEAPKSRPFPIRLDVVVIVLAIGFAFLSMWDDNRGGLLDDGKVPPPFDLVHHQGGRVKLSDYAGKVVVIDFWATWCPPCVEEMPWLVQLTEKYKDGGVVLLAISQDDPADRAAAVNKFVTEKVPGLEKYVLYGDPLVAKNYGVVALPTLYIIGRDGKVTFAARGSVSYDKVEKYIGKAAEQY